MVTPKKRTLKMMMTKLKFEDISVAAVDCTKSNYERERESEKDEPLKGHTEKVQRELS